MTPPARALRPSEASIYPPSSPVPNPQPHAVYSRQLTSRRIHRMTRSVLLAVACLSAAHSLAAQASPPACAPDNAGLTLQPGFCALVVAESLGSARHLVVLEN